MTQPKRHGSTDFYRYGFQGQEKDDEVKGEGNSINTHFRRYDPRIGRWLSPDPKESLMPFETPYSYANNTPVVGNDPDGDICPPCVVAFYYLLTAEGAALAGGALLTTYYVVNYEQINRGTQKLARMMAEMEFTITHNGDTPTMAPGFTSTETPALVVLDTPDLSDKTKEQIVHGMTVVQDATSGYKPGFDKLPLEVGSGNITTIPVYEPKTKGASILGISSKPFELGYVFKEGIDQDFRGTNKGVFEALNSAFEAVKNKTGVNREDFEITQWSKTELGKSFPVEYQAKDSNGNLVEVNIDFSHTTNGTLAAPHVGYKLGKKATKEVGHIILDNVPAGRTNKPQE